MINAPQGMATSLPAAHGSSSCAVTQAPPTLVGGGTPSAAAGVSLPVVPPFGSAAVPTTAATAATIGATTIGGALPAPPSAAPVSTGFLASTNIVPAAAIVPGVNAPFGATATPAPAAAGTLPGPASVTAAVTATPGMAGATGAPTAATAARPLTTVAPGGSPQDAALVERTLGVLRQSPAGAQVVDRLLAVGARVNVISDEEFRAMGHGEAHAFYDPKIDTMFLRRSDLANDQDVKFAAIALAHEGTHLLDDVAKLSEPFIGELSSKVAAAGGLGTAQGIAARDQGLFELTMIKETRAFTFAGQVARELGVQLPANDPTSAAVAGANDQATYLAVWQRLLQSSYNPGGRSATPRNL